MLYFFQELKPRKTRLSTRVSRPAACGGFFWVNGSIDEQCSRNVGLWRMEPRPVLELLKMCGNMCDRGVENLGEHSIAIS
jgi:hypothetical protein